MFELVGVRGDYVNCDHCSEEIWKDSEIVIATFDNKEDADEYIKRSHLKCSGGFRVKSLLWSYRDVFVRECAIPHNPEINW